MSLLLMNPSISRNSRSPRRGRFTGKGRGRGTGPATFKPKVHLSLIDFGPFVLSNCKYKVKYNNANDIYLHMLAVGVAYGRGMAAGLHL